MSETNHIIEFLRSVQPFNTLNTAVLEKVSQQLEVAYYPQNKTIFSSDSSPGLAVIRKGAVRLVDQKHKFLDKRYEGELFGHAIYFHLEFKQYIAEAEEDSLIWHLGAKDFVDLCEQETSFNEYFNSYFHSRLNATTGSESPASIVSDLIKRKPVLISDNASIFETAQLMSKEDVSSVLITENELLVGIVTDKDLRHRVLARAVDPASRIGDVMTVNPQCLAADDDLNAALLHMMRESYHHLPVVTNARPVGLVTAGDILRAQSEHPLRLVRDILKRDTIDELITLSRRLPLLFERTVNLGRNSQQVGQMVTSITDAFTARLLVLAEQRFGPAPIKYAWLAFGSQAREEQTARTDQDNALIFEHTPDAEQAEYFSKLAEFVCDGLDKLGYVYCPGEIMALNVKWRLSLKQWNRQFSRWIEEPDPLSVMHCSIFFDMRCIFGDCGLVEKLQAEVVSKAKANRLFRRFMAENSLTHRPPLGFFRRFVQEDDGSHSEGLNLKHRGIVPITDLVRIRALEVGITEANTFRRIELAAEAGVINKNDALNLRDALNLINQIRLTHQSRQMEDGNLPTNFVPIDDLSPLKRRNLKAAFLLILKAQQAMALRYQLG